MHACSKTFLKKIKEGKSYILLLYASRPRNFKKDKRGVGGGIFYFCMLVGPENLKKIRGGGRYLLLLYASRPRNFKKDKGGGGGGIFYFCMLVGSVRCFKKKV